MARPNGRFPLFLCVTWLVLSLLLPAHGEAQLRPDFRVAEAGEIQELHLVDGSTLVGRVVEAGDPIRFALVSGSVIEVAWAKVSTLRTVEGTLHEGEVWRRDPSANRLFFGPTARMVGEGRGYLAVFEAFFPSVSVGLSDNVTIGGGTLLLDSGGANRPFWFVPKVKLMEEDGSTVSVGALAITDLEDGWAGILYGVLTHGDADNAVTLGLGYGWIEDDLADTPAVLFGAETRVARGMKLITENYLIPTGDRTEVLFSAGPRFFTERLSADLGIATISGGSGFFPLVNFVYNW